MLRLLPRLQPPECTADSLFSVQFAFRGFSLRREETSTSESENPVVMLIIEEKF